MSEAPVEDTTWLGEEVEYWPGKSKMLESDDLRTAPTMQGFNIV